MFLMLFKPIFISPKRSSILPVESVMIWPFEKPYEAFSFLLYQALGESRDFKMAESNFGTIVLICSCLGPIGLCPGV